MKTKQAKNQNSEKKALENQEINQLKSKIEEYTNHLQRMQAEFDNFRKRTEKEKQNFTKYAKEEIILNLLSVIDNFELAFNQAEDNEFSKGIKLIQNQLITLLKKEGLTKIECLNKKFNPEEHEVIIQEKHESEDGTIIGELQKGYKLHDRLLRPAKVKISKKSGGKKNE